jgi:hypothetical protein
VLAELRREAPSASTSPPCARQALSIIWLAGVFCVRLVVSLSVAMNRPAAPDDRSGGHGGRWREPPGVRSMSMVYSRHLRKRA